MSIPKRSVLMVVLLVCAVAAGGCTAKARALRIAVGQFEVEAIAAVNAIDAMRQREIAPVEQTPAAAVNAFVDNVMHSTRPATEERVKLWLNPDAVEQDPAVEQAWSDFLAGLRTQYTTFARIFDEIEQASFTAREIVRKAAPHIDKLTAQLAYFAASIGKHPPRLLQRHAALLTSLEQIRQSNATEAEKRRQIAAWSDQWLSLLAEEEELKRTTVEQCLKAVVIGLEIRKQILNYDQLSLGDISEAVTQIFRVAGSITGEDFSHLQAQSERIVAKLNDDPVWKTTVDTALREVNRAIATRSRQGGLPLGAPEASPSVTPQTQ